MKKQLLTGNEAAARGAYEAGIHFASAYPGTPSTEILENITAYDEVYTEWAPNEKVALEAAIGASVAGARALCSMKHVGMNVAADPLFTFAYTGVNGGTVIITADEPGQHSSQNEQDNRNYAKAAKIPMVEPSDSQECLDMMKEAFAISEKYDTPVIYRMTTRICHSKSITETGEREDIAIRPVDKNPMKYVSVPANARRMRAELEVRLADLKEFSEETPLNRVEYHDKKIGVITSGAAYTFAREVFGENASYLKLGFTNPLPDKKISAFCEEVETVYIIEENDPYIEERVRLLGFDCKGKDTFPAFGEMTPDVIRKSVYGETMENIEYDHSGVVGRPPALCAGCPHRGFFFDLGKRKDVLITGDIGCYTLGFAKPYAAIDTTVCMGASFSMGHGAQTVMNMNPDNKMRVVSVLGDSTFFHSGINSLMDIVYNGSNPVCVILDNRITGMTGHQENPGSGYTAKRDPATLISIENMVRAMGVKNVKVVNPNKLSEMKEAMDEALALDEPSVIITRWPCILKRFSQEDLDEFKGLRTDKYEVDEEICIGCRMCLKSGCPAISFKQEEKKATIDPVQCVGCEVCAQICPTGAIQKKEARA